MIRLFSLLLTFCLVLSACTTAPKGPEHAVNLTAQLEKVAEVQKWQMRGKIAFRQGKEAASLNLVWKNDFGDFDFRLTNFLGVSLVNLNVSEHKSVLVANGETYVDALPEPLIYQVTGMLIPVESLLSWVKGLPLEGDKFTLTEKGLVNTLESYCQGCRNWQVAYSNYGSVDVENGESVWLPHSITLTQNETPNMPLTQLKIKIYQWNL
ncbi:lipoprotein insertase outer membrane protein LolB [Alteromonas sp. ALT199]|uniref:lipoprotein insertase outer membrane protein LolB n=1 Tax=unclassified Alteromonas TaxID=2614992 RepID=UPI000447CD58|nr:lipoprotein insertase outer membrane protein LolB [Alteromonas sp. ALT199]MBT3135064.1 lipoprotein insertase outer membrane protein LolB [Alteromonas sp. ALT199]